MANENVINRKEVKLTLRDGKEYSIQPLTIDELIGVWPIIEKLEQAENKVDVSLLEDIKKLVYAVLKDQVSEEKEVGTLVDMVDLQVIVQAIIGQQK